MTPEELKKIEQMAQMPDIEVTDPVIVEQQQEYSVIRENIFDWNKAYIRLKNIRDGWNEYKTKALSNRKYRHIDVDPAQLRKTDQIGKDETIVVRRTIDTNIKREKPTLVDYLKNSRRLVTFTDIDDPRTSTGELEEAFTRGMTYEEWEEDWNKEIDGHQCHGWASIEVVFDESKPLHVGLEYVAYDELFFPKKTRKLQNAPIIIREYSLTKEQLRMFVRDFGFSKEQVDIVTKSKNEASTVQDEPVIIYKKYCKYEGIVYVAWFSLDHGVTDWLKAPAKYFCGIKRRVTIEVSQQVDMPSMDELGNIIGVFPQTVMVPQETWEDEDITQYPIFLLPYAPTEEPDIVDGKGRAFFDLPTQEALTAGWSGLINGLTRSTNVYGSPDADDMSGAAPKQLDIQIDHGKLYNKRVNFWSMPAPDFTVLPALQSLQVEHSQEVGQINFAVQNKRGSRTTAKEVQAAESENATLKSPSLTLFSSHVRQVYSFGWLIAQSQALQGLITLAAIAPEIIERRYELRAAGDIDVVQRNEKLTKMFNFWPIVSAVGQMFPQLTLKFLTNMLSIAFPEDAAEYKMLIEQGVMNDKATIQALIQILQASLSPEEIQALSPDVQMQLQQIIQQASGSVSQQQMV